MSVVDLHIKNPEERNDFICGRRICTAATPAWIQRITDRYGLVLTLGGSGLVGIGSGETRLEAGDLVLLKPEFQHRFRPENEWDILWFHFLPRPHDSILSAGYLLKRKSQRFGAVV